MKLFLLLFVALWAIPQANERFETDFAKVSQVYERNAKPYLSLFAEKQFPPLPADATDQQKKLRKLEVESVMRVHESYVTAFTKESFDVLKRELSAKYKAADYTKLVNQFESGYKNLFLFLDYEFYSKCRQDLRE